MRKTKLCLLVFLGMACVAAGNHVRAQSSQQARKGEGVVHADMKNVFYHFTDPVAVHIIRLNGAVLPTHREGIVNFDDKNSFSVELSYAEISVSTTALTNAMNQYVFAAADAPLKNLVITPAGTSLKIKGKLHSKGNVPFESEGTIDATPEGLIRIRTRKIKAAHLPVKGLMDLLGVNIADLINTRKVAGVRSEGDDLLLDPQQIFPPPHIKGKVTGVEIKGDQIVQLYGDKPKESGPPPVQGNYMAYRGGLLRFGKLTMTDSDMILIDMNPRDPFDFSLDHYNDQLVAGYTKNTPEHGLRVFMPDFYTLRKPRSKTPAKAQRAQGSQSQ